MSILLDTMQHGLHRVDPVALYRDKRTRDTVRYPFVGWSRPAWDNTGAALPCVWYCTRTVHRRHWHRHRRRDTWHPAVTHGRHTCRAHKHPTHTGRDDYHRARPRRHRYTRSTTRHPDRLSRPSFPIPNARLRHNKCGRSYCAWMERHTSVRHHNPVRYNTPPHRVRRRQRRYRIRRALKRTTTRRRTEFRCCDDCCCKIGQDSFPRARRKPN